MTSDDTELPAADEPEEPSLADIIHAVLDERYHARMGKISALAAAAGLLASVVGLLAGASRISYEFGQRDIRQSSIYRLGQAVDDLSIGKLLCVRKDDSGQLRAVYLADEKGSCKHPAG